VVIDTASSGTAAMNAPSPIDEMASAAHSRRQLTPSPVPVLCMGTACGRVNVAATF
jgi:hypothetical protein